MKIHTVGTLSLERKTLDELQIKAMAYVRTKTTRAKQKLQKQERMAEQDLPLQTLFQEPPLSDVQSPQEPLTGSDMALQDSPTHQARARDEPSASTDFPGSGQTNPKSTLTRGEKVKQSPNPSPLPLSFTESNLNPRFSSRPV